MICHTQRLVVDIFSEFASPEFLQAKCHFDEALANFPDRDKVRVNLHTSRFFRQAAERQAPRIEAFPYDSAASGELDDQASKLVSPSCVPRLIFNQQFYVCGVQPAQRYASALEGMLILSRAASMSPSESLCPLGHGLV